MVVNDEAHHVRDEKLKWNQTIERLHASCKSARTDDPGAGVVAQLDFSATPKDQKGGIFRHVVVDYPLAQAVADGIVKTPVIGEVHGRRAGAGRLRGAALPAVDRRRRSGAGASSTRRSRQRASARCCS